jgi:subtilisin family serine protease
MATIAQNLNTFGYSPVLAFTRRAPARTAAADRAESAQTMAKLVSHFSMHPDSQLAQLTTHAPVAAAAGSRRRSTEQPAMARVYPNLGIVYGTVDREGWAALRRAPEVARVSVAPQLSLIRPVARAAAHLEANTTWGIRSLGVPQLWASGLSGEGVKIAHLDTGVAADHPALREAIAAYAEFDVDGTQLVDAEPHDSDLIEGHGTHTAATIAGRAVRKRHVGVAPGASLYAATVIEGGNVIARVLAGMEWAVTEGIRVLSLSLGVRGYVTDFLGIVDVLRDSGVLPIVAVGNEGVGTSRSPGNYPRVISVGYYAQGDLVADDSSSQRFPRRSQPLVPDVVAPGEDIVSAAAGGGWRQLSGSSMAVPHVTGLAALLLEAHPAATVAKLERAIQGSAQLGPLPRDRANRGAVNAPRALTALEQAMAH